MLLPLNTLVENFKAISKLDPALDVPADPHDPNDPSQRAAHEVALADFEQRWKLHRDGVGPAPLRPGQHPTYFKLRHLTSVERVWLLEVAQNDERGLYLAAAAIALLGVENFKLPSGQEIEVKRELARVGPLHLEHASKDTLDQIPPAVLLELGALVMQRAAARPS